MQTIAMGHVLHRAAEAGYDWAPIFDSTGGGVAEGVAKHYVLWAPERSLQVAPSPPFLSHSR